MSRARILVVDDEPDMREMLQFHLSEEGFEVATVADGPAALHQLGAQTCDLVLLDLHLPRMTGYQVLDSIRQRWPQQLVITVSSTVVGPAPTSSARSDGHLDKPFELEELSQVVAEILGAARPAAVPAAGADQPGAGGHAGAVRAGREPTARSAAILVIDDEQDMRDMLAFELSQEGFEVTTAASGMAAVEAIRHRKFDLAVTDLKMPGMDGVQTVAALKQVDPDIEIIVATGYATVETAVACIKNGAYDYIRKPYDLQDLRLLLERALERSSLQGSVALFEASRVLLGTLKQSDLVRAVIAPATRILGADGVGLTLIEKDPVSPTRISGGPHPPPPALLDYLTGRAHACSGSLRLPGPDQPLPAEVAGAGFASALIYRLASHDQPLGALVLLRRTGAIDFAGSELQRGSVFASQVAMALDNARLYSALDERLRELLATRDQLVRSEKLAVASKLAGGVAHEINNPLAAVTANLGALRGYSATVRGLWTALRGTLAYLRERTDVAGVALNHRLTEAIGNENQTELVIDDIGAVVEETVEAARRISELIAGFTQMSGPDQLRPLEHIDLSELLQHSVTTAASGSKNERPTVTCDVPEGLGALAAIDYLRIALLNLLGFAVQQEVSLAGPLAGRVEVEARLEDGQPNIRIRLPHLQVAAAQRAELFDPRIEVRPDGTQTLRLDIRLPIAHQLLDRTGAQLMVDDAPGGGLQFRIVLTPALTQHDGQARVA